MCSQWQEPWFYKAFRVIERSKFECKLFSEIKPFKSNLCQEIVTSECYHQAVTTSAKTAERYFCNVARCVLVNNTMFYDLWLSQVLLNKAPSYLLG